MKKPTSIEARSICSGRNLEPYIHIVQIYDDGSEEQVTQWTPNEARHHAMCVLEAADAAESDSFIVDFITTKVGVPVEKAVNILQDFRKWRERRRPPEKPM